MLHKFCELFVNNRAKYKEKTGALLSAGLIINLLSKAGDCFPEALEEVYDSVNDILEGEGNLVEHTAVFKQLRGIHCVSLIGIKIVLIESDYAETSVLIVIGMEGDAG